MGIYDRDYYRGDEPRGVFGGDQSMVVTLILVTGAIFLVQVFAGPTTGRWIDTTFGAGIDTLWKPWMWWQFITYGFLHDRQTFLHVFFNMLGLWFFGRDVETIYGRKQFLWLYLTALVAAGVGWALVELSLAPEKPPLLIGASGAITAVLLIFCLHFPHQRVLMMMIFPVPAWLLAVVLIGGDLVSALNNSESNVAYMAHLSGAAYGYVFYRTRWSFFSLAPSQFSLASLQRRMTRPKLRVHRPDPAPRSEDNLPSRVDAILEKISRSGQDSLTPEERSILENASRHYQQQRRK